MPIPRMLCAILFAVGYQGSMEAQEPPVPQLSPGSEHKPASTPRLQTTLSSLHARIVEPCMDLTALSSPWDRR